MRFAVRPWHKDGMTVLHKLATADVPRHAGGAVNVSRAIGGAAPALFRLLSDSALNRAALDVCGAAVAIVDATEPSHPLVYANPAFSALTGREPSDCSGRSMIPLLVIDATAIATWLPAGGDQARIEFQLRRADGSTVRVEAVAGDVRGTRGQRTHWVLTFSDLERLGRG